jgi:hypothetical protein
MTQHLVEEPATAQANEETTQLKSRRCRSTGHSHNFCRTDWKRMMVHLDCLAPYQGTAGDEWPLEGNSGSSYHENRPQEERRLEAKETRRKCHLPGQMHMSQACSLGKEIMVVSL